MSIIKDLYMEEYDNIMAEAEESGQPIDDNKAALMAMKRGTARFADMCDEAKDRAKYER